MAFLLVLSHHWIRKIYYDAFLAIHISLALAVLVCVYFHVENMDDPSFFAFIWTCVAMWSFDRALRLGRVLYHSLLPNAKGIKALASYVPESDIIRLDVSKFFPRGEPSAVGAYYYVYEPGRIRGYESHPFTLCSWNRTSSGSNVMRTPTTSVGKEFQIAATDVEDGSPPSPAPSTSQETSHSFLIQPQHGFTQELRQKISSQEEIKAYPLTVLLEGPYGEQFPLERHSDVLMIIGGSGITAAVSRAYDLLSKSNARLHIVWAVRNKALVHTVCDHEFNSLLGHENVRLDVYLTKDTADPEKVFRHGVQLYEGRPVIESLLAEAIAQSSSSVGVFCCGPTRMGATCRVEIAKLMRSQQADVKFYEERFGW